jgi:hypothetical protein
MPVDVGEDGSLMHTEIGVDVDFVAPEINTWSCKKKNSSLQTKFA